MAAIDFSTFETGDGFTDNTTKGTVTYGQLDDERYYCRCENSAAGALGFNRTDGIQGVAGQVIYIDFRISLYTATFLLQLHFGTPAWSASGKIALYGDGTGNWKMWNSNGVLGSFLELPIFGIT